MSTEPPLRSRPAEAPRQPDVESRVRVGLDAGLRRLGYGAFRPGQRDAIEALLRARRIADGYHSTRTDPETMRERMRIVGEAATAAGRPVPTASTRLTVDFSSKRSGPSIVAGPPEQMAALLRQYRDAGTEHAALDFGEVNADAAARAIERFDREVLPLL